MGLVLKEDKPLFRFLSAIVLHLHRYHNRTGIDLVRLLQILQLSLFFQLSHRHKCQIHQTDESVAGMTFLRRFLPENLLSRVQITAVSNLQRRTIISLSEFYIRQFRRKSGMPAMIRPVSIQYTDFRHGRIPLLIITEVISDMQKIFEGHSQ